MNNNIVPVTYSTIDKQFLEKLVVENYAIPPIQRILFYRRSLNDTYIIRTKTQKYVMRVYRKWRTVSDVEFEMAWLAHLNFKHAPVMQVIAKKDNTFCTTIQAPEGLRCIVLFPWLEEIFHQPLTRDTAYTCGESLAKIHLSSDDFKTDFNRLKLDEEHLIDEPMKGIVAWYGETRDLSTLKRYAEQAKNRMRSLSRQGSQYGVCHGDTYFSNLMFTKGNEPLWIDFDCCGLGYRIYDIASFYWALKIKWEGWHIEYNDSDAVIWKSFLEGYQKIRILNQQEWESLPDFVIARGLWALGLHPNNIDDWSSESCEEGGTFLDQHLELFKNGVQA